MSRIPDGRTDEYYNQKYLNEKDTEFLHGFDWCVEMAVDNFFDNDMFELQDEDLYLGHILCEKLPDAIREEYEMEHTFSDREDADIRTVETYADLIRMKLLEWIEMERNELITSMLEGLTDEEYNEIKAKVDGRSTENDRKPS